MSADITMVRTPVADVAVRIAGPVDGAPVILMHGWPDDALTWNDIVTALAADGFRTYAPYVRGFGPTALHPEVMRSGEIAALARDVLHLAEALGIERFHFVGHDWGARAGYAAAVLAPERLRSLTALAVAYGTNVASQTMDMAQTRAYWYQWYFATPRGAAHLERERVEFTRALWQWWSPGWRFRDDEFAATAASFQSPDWLAITLHSYRQRWGHADGDPLYAGDRALLDRVPPVTVPTLAILGTDDGATLPGSARGREALFAAPYRLEIVPQCGHFIPRERPRDVLALVRPHLAAQ